MINLIQNTIGALGRSGGGGGDTTSFITTWRTTTASESITIPTTGTGYNYAISTSDGQTFSGLTGDKTITFTNAGDYDISISGDFPTIQFAGGGDKLKLIDIKQWGNIAWSLFGSSFYGCSNMGGSFTDTPNLSGVVDMSQAFRGATSFNVSIDNWDFSTITSMYAMFYQLSSYNQSLGGLDISNVGSMSYLLSSSTLSATNYDSTLIGWEATLQAAFPSGTGYTPTINVHFGSSKYTGGGAAATARASLISNFGWTITDGGIA